MLALINSSKPVYGDIDEEHFKSVLTVSKKTLETKRECKDDEDLSSRSLQLLRVRGSPRLLPEGISTLVNYCRCLRELVLSYSLLSDELLLALSAEQQVELETLRLEAHSDSKVLPRVSDKAWTTFADRFPNINLVILSYVTDENEDNPLFAAHVPLTHLYFGETPPDTLASRIGQDCPRLVELVIASYGPELVDRVLINAAQGCPRLSAVGLGDCEVSCTGLLEFVAICAERLKILYVRETSLVEELDLDILKMASSVSSLLGRTWVPEYVPLW